MSRMPIFVCLVIFVCHYVAHGSGNPTFNINPEINVEGFVADPSCDVLGTASHPAYSCEHLKNACDNPSGEYFILTAGVYTQVYCEMDLQGGGWARYGLSGQGGAWNYVDQDQTEVTLEIISQSDVKEMIDLKYNRFLVQTDVVFKLQGDNSVNPSSLTTRSIPWLEETAVYIDAYANDHTRVEFVSGSADRITCYSGGSSKCGLGGTPAVGKESKPFFFESLYFGPRASGASLPSAHADQWERNKYTWNGSFYYVYAK